MKKAHINADFYDTLKKHRVFVCLRILLALGGLLLSLFSVNLYAQTAVSPQQESKDEPQQQTENPLTRPSPQATATGETQPSILRLEDTIRGNREQPQVLTIVPWQLPVHQRINEGSEWQLRVNPLPAIERHAFLRNMALMKELEAASAATKRPKND